MHALISRSPNAEALRAELHRDELFREAAASRLARSAAAEPASAAAGPGFAGRIRVALRSWGRPVQGAECAECA
jgi:hypothetical protein